MCVYVGGGVLQPWKGFSNVQIATHSRGSESVFPLYPIRGAMVTATFTLVVLRCFDSNSKPNFGSLSLVYDLADELHPWSSS